MRTIKTREAAALLCVTPNTVRSWEAKFGWPRALESNGRHRSYNHGEIVALRDALRRGMSIESAVSAARDEIGADDDALVAALRGFDAEAADRVLEASVLLRSTERTVEEILLPGVAAVRRLDGRGSASWAFTSRWADEWMARMRRTVGPPNDLGVLIGDATTPDDASVVLVRAFALACASRRLRQLVVPVCALDGLGPAVDALHPRCVVIAGDGATDDAVARWAWTVRRCAGQIAIAIYGRQVEPDGAPRRLAVLPGRPGAAAERLEYVLRDLDARTARSVRQTHEVA